MLAAGAALAVAAGLGFAAAQIDDSEGAGSKALVSNAAAIDVHLHLGSQVIADVYTGGEAPASTVEDLVARLDEANVERGVVLAAGYMGWPLGFTDDSNVAPENDFVAGEIAKYPDRLIGFCGINPLFDSALAEIDRCLDLEGMVGLKLHMAGSGVDLTDPGDVAALDAVFARAEALDVPVLIHAGTEFGLALDSAGFTNLALILDEHAAVRVVHAHCAGPRDDQGIEAWIRNGLVGENSFVEGSACLAYFKDAPAGVKERIVWQFRNWGIDRVFLGSDYISFGVDETPKEAIETLLSYPFTQAEIDTILSNDGSAWLGQ
jgi:predicted TIM-barrel fold metal-dependent hydrolase